LELPGEPLDSAGLLVGPEGAAAMGARIRAASTRKRFPEFGVGVGGASGWRLWLMPAVKEVQLIKGDEVVARQPYAWESGKWTWFRLQTEKTDGKWKISGKVWAEGQQEPAGWAISAESGEEPRRGRDRSGGRRIPGRRSILMT